LGNNGHKEFSGRPETQETEFKSASVAKQGRSMLRPYKWPNILLRAAIAYLFGNGQGVIDARSNGGPLQIIAGQPEAMEARASLCDCRQAVAMAEIVLRQRASPNGDI
jgi:hypothetical protein